MEINHGRKYLKKVQSVLDLLQISACVGLKIASGPSKKSDLRICSIESSTEIWGDSSFGNLVESENFGVVSQNPHKPLFPKETKLKDESKLLNGCTNYQNDSVKYEEKSLSYTCSNCWMNAHVNKSDDLLINAQHNLIKEGFEKFSDSPKYQEQFSNDPYLIKHPNAFSQGHEFSCDYCFSTFTKRAKLERHQRKYHVGQNKKYPCSQCSKVFVNKANVLRHHLDKHVKIQEERVQPKIQKLIEKPKANEGR